MNDSAKTSVVALVLHFRDSRRTLMCLQSLIAESVANVVLVDNSEDDGRSFADLLGMCAHLRKDGLKIHGVDPGGNVGFAKGVNLGLADIQSKFGNVHVLLLNNDAELLPGSFARLVSASLSFEGNAMVAPTLVTPIGDFSSLAWYQPYFGLIVHRRVAGALMHLGGCCLLIPSRLATPPLFDEDFFFYGEDFELGARCVRQNILLVGENDARVKHVMSAGSKNGSLFYEYHMARAHLVVVGKLARSIPEACLMWAGRGITLPARAFLRSLRNRSVLPMKGLAMALVDFARGKVRRLTPPANP